MNTKRIRRVHSFSLYVLYQRLKIKTGYNNNNKRKNEWKAAALAVQRRKKRGMAKEKCGRDGERRAECRLWQSASGPRLVVLCKRFKVGALLTSQRLRRMSWCKLWARLRKRHQKIDPQKETIDFSSPHPLGRWSLAWRVPGGKPLTIAPVSVLGNIPGRA